MVAYGRLSTFTRKTSFLIADLQCGDSKLGVYAMWEKLVHVWGDKLSPQQVYEKVRFFAWNYAVSSTDICDPFYTWILKLMWYRLIVIR